MKNNKLHYNATLISFVVAMSTHQRSVLESTFSGTILKCEVCKHLQLPKIIFPEKRLSFIIAVS